MNFSDLPGLEPDIEQLKKDLAVLCEQSGISRFEPDDIVELLEDGETVDWLISQLQHDNAELETQKFHQLLSSLAAVVAPSKETAAGTEEISEEDQPAAEQASDEAIPLDLSQLDLSQMGPELEALTGIKLPPDFDMSHLQKVMESPRGAFIADFGLFCQEQGVDMNAISDPDLLQSLNEQWMATPREAFDGKTPAQLSATDPSLLGIKKVETYRRPEPRIGRNDPCPCGSGKKYKKCCGRGK